MASVAVVATVARNTIPVGRDAHAALTRRVRSVADNDLDPLAYYAPTRSLSGARAVIPPDESYAVVIGTTRPPYSALAGPALHLFRGTLPVAFKLWLMPRPYVPLSKAQWIIAYDTPVSALGVKAAQTFPLDPDTTVVRVAGR